MQGRLKPSAMVVVVFLAAAGARGETPSAGAAKTDADYSKEAFLIAKVRTVASFENDGTSSRAVTSEVRVQSEAGV
jgi:hypothetical protein